MEVQKICLQKGDLNNMEKRKDIDMLRFYGGDIHQKNKEGEYVITNNLVNPKNKEDVLWGDRDAYRTLNALLFDGIENEKERIYKEKRKLNPVFIELIENTLEIYRGIFAVMCRKKGNQLSVSKVKRVDRKASLMAYLKGHTESFVSCTNGEYDDEFASKNNIILLEIESLENTPYVDYQQVITMQEYCNYDEKEVLFPPFLSLNVSEIELTTKDNHIRDMYGQPPVGKYLLKMEEFPDYRNAITSSREELLNKILDEKDKAVLCLEHMNNNMWKEDYHEYVEWKNNLHSCDVWKNGSKHLYFYTLHNQEHAIVLIQNIVKLIHAIDFLKISAIDYYILFLACYLHDISMVKIPALDSFLTDTNEADELAQELLDEFNKELQKDNLEEKVTENEIKENQNLYEDETINHCYRLVYPNKEENYFPTIKELYDFQVKEENILCDGRVYLAFQDEDSTARTLEEAMLKKILGFNVFHMIKRSEWKKIRKDKNLIFSIPNNKKGEKDSEYSIRKIVEATSNNKTDFMYSVILSENEEKMLPDYIKKGLLWLMK